jgi:hypothetical protein
MWDRINESFELGYSSWRVFRRNPQWVLFPLLSGIASLLVLATFSAPVFRWRPQVFQHHYSPQGIELAVDLLYSFTYYLCNYTVVYFFNSALLACAVQRFKGGRPTLMDGFTCAWQRLPQILGWALVSATVGLALRLISDRSNWIGKIVIAAVGFSWALATYFVVPVMVVENIGPIKAINRSMHLIRKTWGDVLMFQIIGLGFFSLAVMAPGIILVVIGAILPVAQAVRWILIGTGILEIIAATVVTSALNGVYVAALYRYASHGKAPRAFGKGMLRDCFVDSETGRRY